MLPSCEVVAVELVLERLMTDDLVRRLAIEPPNISDFDEPPFELKRFRDMTSSPKIPARERMLVLGAESLPVLNLNRPYCCTFELVSFRQ
jgi:hypothetical protein